MHTLTLAHPERSGASLVLELDGENLPVVRYLGPALPDPADAAALAGERGCPLLIEHWQGGFQRPGLSGHRLGDPGAGDRDLAGRDWSPRFRVTDTIVDSGRLVIEATDDTARLSLRSEAEALAGGSLRLRHRLVNTGPQPYVLDGLEVTVPVPAGQDEALDFTGRHERERVPQRHRITDGLWLRESRYGRPGLGAPSVLVTGTPGFGFDSGQCLGAHVGHSGNSVLRLERSPEDGTTLGGGELLLPGEVVLPEGASYTTPWLYVAVSGAGLDPLAAQWHAWERSLPAHPARQPVVLNVWEAVYFRHDLDLLLELARRAARVGVERFVLDDGWFLGRRDDTAGLGDWEVDPEIWPRGLTPLIDEVRALGMQFGLWFEPEMVNPDSELFRRHPNWALGTGRRTPLLERHQLVLDLTNDDAWHYVFDRVDVVLREHGVDFVKWDHNRDLLDAGSRRHGGAPAPSRQTDALYRMLAELRRRHPAVSWESCASGGGRIDLGVVEHVERFWTSDMTDPLARQQIQLWTSQLIAPEYLGAHVSASPSHQTGRAFSLAFRAATALFYAFGIEWDLSKASEDELDELAGWVALHKRLRPLLHSGRVVRIPVDDPAVLAHGVVAADGSEALLAHVQLDESASNRGVVLRMRGLQPSARYDLEWAGPLDRHPMSRTPQLHPAGPTAARSVSGAALREYGIWMPRRRPQTVHLIRITRTS